MPEGSLLQALVPGGVLISRAVASQVPSALRGLTSVFGMGTGGALLLSSPESFSAALCSACMLAFAYCSLASRRLSPCTFKTAQWKVDLQSLRTISFA